MRTQRHALAPLPVVIPAVRRRLEDVSATFDAQSAASEREITQILPQDAGWAANAALKVDGMTDTPTVTRTQFITGLAAASAGMVAAAALPGSVLAAGRSAVPAGDLAILSFALTLEHLESAFYNQAVANVPFEQAAVRYLAQTLRKDEATHVSALTAAIKGAGGTPVGAAPFYKFGADTFKTQSGFLKLSYMLEDTGVAAYLGQAANIKTPSILLTAASIVTVKARHAGAIRYQYGLQPTISPFDGGYSKDKVLSIAGPLIGT